MALHVNGPVTVEHGLDGRSVLLHFTGADTHQTIVFRSTDHFDTVLEDIERQYARLDAREVA
jgi:hypothetical protein